MSFFVIQLLAEGRVKAVRLPTKDQIERHGPHLELETFSSDRVALMKSPKIRQLLSDALLSHKLGERGRSRIVLIKGEPENPTIKEAIEYLKANQNGFEKQTRGQQIRLIPSNGTSWDSYERRPVVLRRRKKP